MTDPSAILAGEIPGEGGERPWVRLAFPVGPCFLLGPLWETSGLRGGQGHAPAVALEPAAEHTLKETWWPGGRTGHQPERHATGKGLGAGADLQGAVGQGQGA